MAMDFGKLNFAVGFNRTSAFPLDANSYFESYDDAVTAAAGAAEVGSSDSAYYIGQLVIVKDSTVGVGLYQINAGKTLTKFGQASSADELAEKVSALEARCSTIEGKLILATADGDGLMSKEDFAKLTAIEAGAQVNKIESVKVDGTALTITDKAVDIDLAGALAPYAKTADVDTELAKKVESVTAGDASITVGGTAADPTVKVAIAAGEDNALTLAADGLKVVVPDAAEYTIKKLDAATEGMSASYQLTKDGVGVGAVIDIPKDMVVESGSVETYTAETLPEGVTEPGTYIVLTLANATSDKLYIKATDLIEYVTSGSTAGDMVVITIDATTHKVTASITDGTITEAKLDADVKAKLAKAVSAIQSVTVGTTNGTIKVDGTEVAVAGLQDAAYTTVASINATAQDKVDAATEALIGTDADTKSANTIKGAKKYADDAVAASIGDLDYTDTAVEHQFVTDVSETNGVIEVHRKALVAADIPTIEQSQVSGLETALSGKQDNITFNTAYDSVINKAATMTDVNTAKAAVVGDSATDTQASSTIEGAKKYADAKATAAETAAKAYADTLVADGSAIDARIDALEAKHATGKTVAEEVTAGIEALDLADTYAAKAPTEAHIANADIHVTAEKKAAWDGAVTDVTTLKGDESVAGSVKAIAKGYADGKDEAIAAAKKAGDDAQSTIDTYKTSNDARVKAIEDKEATWDGKQDAITDGSAVIATVTDDVVTLKAGVAQSAGAVAQGAGEDIVLAKVAKTGAAEDITVADAGDKFIATNLEAVLAELAASIQTGGAGSVVTCEKTTPEGVAARYVFKQGGVAIANATIDIPKDMVVSAGAVVTKAEAGEWGEAGTYIELTLANATNDKIYVNVGNLIEYVTSGSAAEDSVQVVVSDDHKVTASIKDGSIVLGKLAATVQAEINKAHEHTNKTELDKIVTGDVDAWNAEKGAMAKATENAAAIAALEAVGAQANVIEAIKAGSTTLGITDKTVTIPAATAAALGLVKVDGTSIEAAADGTISVKAVSTDILVQGANELIIKGGDSTL